jgi:hypothetical protein
MKKKSRNSRCEAFSFRAENHSQLGIALFKTLKITLGTRKLQQFGKNLATPFRHAGIEMRTGGN